MKVLETERQTTKGRFCQYLATKNLKGRSGDFSRFLVGDKRLKSLLLSIKTNVARY